MPIKKQMNNREGLSQGAHNSEFDEEADEEELKQRRGDAGVLW